MCHACDEAMARDRAKRAALVEDESYFGSLERMGRRKYDRNDTTYLRAVWDASDRRLGIGKYAR